MKLANVDTTIPATQTAAEILNARFASIFDSRDGLYRNARARDSLLLGWKFARLLGRGAHAIASLWTYKPADDEKLLNWPGENDIHPVQNLVIKQAEGVRESLAEEGKKLQVFTRLGCNHFPKIYDVVHKLQGKTRIDRIFMEYFPNGSLANYMQQYQEMIPMSPQGLKDWQTNPRYGYRNKSGEEPRISEKALWSLFLCLAKSVLAAETGREHIVNFDEDQMHGLVFVPLDLKPDNVLVAAQTDDLEHKYFPRVVWTDFALSLFAPIDWKKLSEKDRREERWRLENTFPGGMIGDYLFMAPVSGPPAGRLNMLIGNRNKKRMNTKRLAPARTSGLSVP